MLLDNKGCPQGHHKKNTKQAAAHGNSRYFKKRRRRYHLTLRRPHKQGRKGKDGPRRQRFSGRPNGLYHIIFQYIVPSQHKTDQSHGDDSRWNRCRHRHSHAKPKIRIRRPKHHCQYDPQDQRYHCKFRHNLVRRDKWFKIIFVFHILYLSIVKFHQLICSISQKTGLQK